MGPRIDAKIQHHFAAKSWNYHFSTETQISVVRGPSGVGKSLLMKILAGVFPSPTCEIWIDGKLMQKSGKCVLALKDRKVSWLPQGHLLFPHLNVRQNLLFSPRSVASELSQVCEGLQISQLLNRNPRNLSGGESQRVALGRALLAKGEVLLLDEPFSALDEQTRKPVSQFVHEWIVEKRLTTVMITHQDQDVDGWDFDLWQMTELGLEKYQRL